MHLWPNLLGVFYPMPLRGRIASVTRQEGFSSMYNLHLSESPMFGLVGEGSTQLPFVLTRAAEGPTSGSRGSASPCDCIYDCNWDCIWLKDNISCRVTFFVIDSSSWSLICWVSCSSSSGAMEEELWEVCGANPKNCFMVIPAPAARTRPGCSGRPMAAVRRSWCAWWRAWGTSKPYDAYSSKESCTKHIYLFSHSQNKQI